MKPTPDQTARQRARDVLTAHPGGLSKSQLRREVGGNAGAFRRLLQSMVEHGEVVVSEEQRPHCGLTKVHRLGRPEQIEGQTELLPEEETP